MHNGTYTVGAALAIQEFPSFVITITLSTGEVLKGLYSDKQQGPITKFMYLGLPLADGDQTADYDDAMALSKQELVLVACLPTVRGCDFSKAVP